MPKQLVRAAGIGALLAFAACAGAAQLDYLGGYAALGDELGVAGLAVGDVDGDGKVEILVTGNFYAMGVFGSFTLLAPDAAAAGGYREIAFSDGYHAGLSAAALLDLRADGRDEVVAGLGDGSVRAYAGTALVAAGSATVDGAVAAFALADADNDGTPDLVVLSANAITLLDPATFASRGSIPVGAAELAIGDVDGDGKNEVVLNTGAVLRLARNGSDLSSEVVWTNPSGAFGVHIGLADIDGDGLPELIAMADWDELTVFDLDVQAQKWQIGALGDLDALALADVNGDGVPDAILGSGQWGSETAIDLTSEDVLWSVPNPEHGNGHVLVADVDNDGAPELVWTAGWSSTGQDVMYVYALSTLSEKFETLDVLAPFDAVAVAPASGTSDARVAFASWQSESGYADGIVWQWDAGTLAPLTMSSPDTFSDDDWTGLHALAYGDVYNMGSPDLLVGTDRLYDGAIYVLDAGTGLVREQRIYDSGSPMNALAVADLDGGAGNEIVAGNLRHHTGSPGAFVYLFDGATGAELWRSGDLSDQFGQVSSVAIGDLDGDGSADIVAVACEFGGDNAHLYQYTGATRAQWESAQTGYGVATAFDIDGDGRDEVVAGRTDGTVVVLDGGSHEVLAAFQVGSGAVSAIEAFRTPAVPGGFVATVVDGKLRVHDLARGGLFAESAANVGPTHGLAVLPDASGADAVRLFVGGETAFRAYRLDTDRIFGNGFD
jgi:hypothetical protein